jgi:hypothetical protein
MNFIFYKSDNTTKGIIFFKKLIIKSTSNINVALHLAFIRF